jgi:TonB family protein
MNHILSPIAFTTILSLALHAFMLAVVLSVQKPIQSTGKGLEIELVSSTHVSNQRETEQAASQAVATSQQDQADETPKSDRVIASKKKEQVKRPQPDTLARNTAPASTVESSDDGADSKVINRSTNASMQDVSIIELLHTKISEHKQYPYMAKRQRREGVARVEFVLHPDGTINDMKLVNSSRVRVLDKAALEAVRGIEPFEPAKVYLHQPEAFQVDVVFNMI